MTGLSVRGNSLLKKFISSLATVIWVVTGRSFRFSLFRFVNRRQVAVACDKLNNEGSIGAEAIDTSWDLNKLFPSRDHVLAETRQIRKKWGAWPISFSYPTSRAVGLSSKTRIISNVIPGNAYSFSHERDYLQEYRESFFSLTHKKAGWDCFRHLEILSCGSIPLMPDSAMIPRTSMVHYPKNALVQVANEFESDRRKPSTLLQKKFQDFFDENLTTTAMAQYIIDAVQVGAEEKVLFVDLSLQKTPDYLSISTLIGLYEVLSERLSVLFPPDYIYDNYVGEVGSLYGRGFGYSRILPAPRKRGVSATLLSQKPADLAAEFDWVIVGNIARNLSIAHTLMNAFPAEKSVWVWGEDQAPSSKEMDVLLASGAELFLRSFPAKLERRTQMFASESTQGSPQSETSG